MRVHNWSAWGSGRALTASIAAAAVGLLMITNTHVTAGGSEAEFVVDGVAVDSSFMRQHAAISEIPAAFGEFLDARPDFGGAYVDSTNGVTLVLLTTGDVNELRKIARSLLPEDIQMSVRSVALSKRQLEADRDAMLRDRNFLLSQGVSLQSLAIDVINNRIQVGIASSDGQNIDILKSRYGQNLEIVDVESFEQLHCVSRGHCANHAGAAPMKGGLYINSGISCTSGFRARLSQGIGAYYLLTAGHCIQAAGLGATWNHHTTGAIGTGSSAVVGGGVAPRVDAGIISLNSSNIDFPANYIYKQVPDTFGAITSITSNGSQFVGLVVCSSRAASDSWSCGTITHADTWVPCGGGLTNQWRTSIVSIGGDSGAPIVNSIGTSGLGVVACGGTIGGVQTTSYSTLANIAIQTGYTICTSAAC